MNDDEKLLWMFTQVHGLMDGSCSAVVFYDEDDAPYVAVLKNGCESWRATKLDIVFDYLTKDL